MNAPLHPLWRHERSGSPWVVWGRAEGLLRDTWTAGLLLALLVLLACILPYRVSVLLAGLCVLLGAMYDGLRGALAFTCIVVAGVNSYALLRSGKLMGNPLVDIAVLAAFALVLGSFVEGLRASARPEERNYQPYDTLVKLIQEGLIVVDLNENVLFANDACAQMLGYGPGELNGKNLSELTTREQFEVYREKTRQRKRGYSDRYEARMTRKDGSSVDVLVSATPFRGSDGEVKGIIGVFWDITDRKREEEQLRRLSLHDSLTGAYNRAYFGQQMERMDERRYLPVSMIVCDVDDLKQVNDKFGHAAGDEVLVRSASIVKSSVRATDIVARIGGDEFAVILPNTDVESARRICERIRHRVELDGSLRTRLSVGSATRESMDLDMSELFKKADDAMYREKLTRAEAEREARAGMPAEMKR